jgi:hypothetical protein
VRKNRKMRDMSNFEREQIVGVRLAGASVIINCHVIRRIESDSF